MRTKSGQKGFTLVEVMIVVAIIGILAAVATPVLLNALPNMRLRGAARDIYSVMMQTKVEALRRGENVTVLFVPPAGTYTMFIDTDNNESVDVGETVLVAATQLPGSVSFDPNGVTDLGAPFVNTSFANHALVFTPRGIPASAANDPPSGLGSGTVGLRAVDSSGATIRQRNITVSTAGRINISVK